MFDNNRLFGIIEKVKPTVYVETSVVSYLTARPTRDVLATAWQRATRIWWANQRFRFDLFTSELVDEECGEGHPEAANRRMVVLAKIPHLTLPRAVADLADKLMRKGALPASAATDALHVAVSAYHDLDYLLTWNCRHINNGETKNLMRSVCANQGYVCPEICTPLELMEGRTDVR